MSPVLAMLYLTSRGLERKNRDRKALERCQCLAELAKRCHNQAVKGLDREKDRQMDRWKGPSIPHSATAPIPQAPNTLHNSI
jgi:hypothetical protein